MIYQNSFLEKYKDASYFGELDFIKAVAIFSVIILHSVPPDALHSIFAPFHIWHAVPIFILISGVTSTVSIDRRGNFSILEEYSVKRFFHKIRRILLPFTLVWLLEAIVLLESGKENFNQILRYYLVGGVGPGSYFTPLFIQHLLVFPIIYWILNKFAPSNKLLFLCGLFLFSLFIEWICVLVAIPDWIYRFLYIRYFFASILGIYYIKGWLSIKQILFFAPLSILYIFLVSYLDHSFLFIYPSWDFHHAPAYFYTLILVFFLGFIYRVASPISFYLENIGKASYHIFLIQMLWFWIFPKNSRDPLSHTLFFIVTSLFFPVFIGYLYYKLQCRLENRCFFTKK